MNVERFVAERQPMWDTAEGLLARAGRRPERMDPAAILSLGRAYRAVSADLAIARRICAPTDPVLIRLEDLVRRARSVVYDAEPRRTGIVAFFSRDYWRAIRERPVLLTVAAVALFLPSILGTYWAYVDPAGAQGFIPGFFLGEGPLGSGSDGVSIEEGAFFSSMIFTNNIRVTFLAFAGGIAWGLGTAYILVFNGAMLGVLGGLVSQAGHGERFFELVAPHGVLELSCIVASGTAGLRLGWALVDPGMRTRQAAVVAEGRRSVEIILGTIPWLVLAGLVEGFITPQQIGLVPALILGFGLAAIWWGFVWWRGGKPPPVAEPAAADHNRARDLARR